ncbi:MULTISPECIES: hypothetical protein [Aeribacillus]|uniref:hypothetical protein n=1 Tax=Aeribacillus TaxID=1055323 RepID=UPI001023BC25|nr:MULTISPECIES: hypothetical protein [Aeribacillus]MED0703967.1 hypothetical protein [Aeribacillus composti]RZI51746.1 hypothetical protein EW027_08310 [Aeribacillus pallidus]
MNFEQAFNEFAYNRIEQALLNRQNRELKALYNELEEKLKKLGIAKNDCDDLKGTIYCLMDTQNLLVYRQALADVISFLINLEETKAGTSQK